MPLYKTHVFIYSLLALVCADILRKVRCRRRNHGASRGIQAGPRYHYARWSAAKWPFSFNPAAASVADETSDVAPPGSGTRGGHSGECRRFCDARPGDRPAGSKRRKFEAAAGSGGARRKRKRRLRQSQSRIGLGQNSSFDANTVPEVQGAMAAYNSAQAQAKLAAADEKRYANLVATGDVSQSNYEKQRTQAETAQAQADAARKQYETALNNARQNYQGVSGSEASLTGFRTQVAMARKAIEDTIVRAPMSGYVSDRPIAVGEYVSDHIEDRHGSSRQPNQAVSADLRSGGGAAAHWDVGHGSRDRLWRPGVHGTRNGDSPGSRPDFARSDGGSRIFEPGLHAAARHVRHRTSHFASGRARACSFP